MVVVQIGANRGNDELTSIIQGVDLNKLILIEPFEKFNQSLLECYNNIDNLFIENVAITDNKEKEFETFYLHEKMDQNVEQASMLKSHIEKVFNKPEYVVDKTYDEQVIELKIKCSTINDIFNKYNLQSIDILFIDAEGFDDKIIKSIDFEKFNVDKIYYENMHINNDELSLFLKNKNYNVINGTPITIHNSLAIKNN